MYSAEVKPLVAHARVPVADAAWHRASVANRIEEERLLRAMKAAGIRSRAELARRVGIDRSQVSRWISGETTPSGDVLDRLYSTLGCAPGFLFGAEEQPADALTAALARVPPEKRDRVAEAIELALRMMGEGEPEPVRPAPRRELADSRR